MRGCDRLHVRFFLRSCGNGVFTQPRIGAGAALTWQPTIERFNTIADRLCKAYSRLVALAFLKILFACFMGVSVGRLLTLMFCLACGLSASTHALADDWMECERHHWDDRIAGCTRIILKRGTSNKDLTLAYGLRGGAYLNKGDRDKAIADFTAAIRLNPGPSMSQYLKGLRHVANGENDAAIVEFDAAIRLDPKNVRALNSRGSAFNRKGDPNRAVTDLNEAIRIDPNFALAYNNRGVSYRGKGEHDRAIADFSEAIRLEPRFTSAHRSRGSIYVAKGDYDRAVADFDQTIRLDPNLASAYQERGWAYFSKGEYDRAIADSSTAIRLDPNNVSAYNTRGRAYGAKGEHDRSITDFSDAVRIAPRYVHGYNNRGLAYAKKGEIDSAIAEYEAAIRIDPNYVLAYNNRGNAYAKKGETDRATADFTKVLDLPAPTASDKQRQEVARERIGRLKQMTHAAVKHRRVALVIGNAKYAKAAFLTNPLNDAKAFAAALRRLDFTLVIEEHDASRDGMAQALKTLGDHAEGAEWAVVFFAGHGLELNGTTYLIPVDAELKRDTHIEDEAVSLNRVQAKVDAASQLGLVILDSCRNSPFLARMTRASGGATRAIGNGLAAIEPEGNVLVAYSAKHGTVAEDGTGQHSPFTEALLAHIEEPGLEINFLFRRVRDAVRKKTERRQEPFLYGSLGSEPIFFKTASTK